MVAIASWESCGPWSDLRCYGYSSVKMWKRLWPHSHECWVQVLDTVIVLSLLPLYLPGKPQTAETVGVKDREEKGKKIGEKERQKL